MIKKLMLLAIPVLIVNLLVIYNISYGEETVSLYINDHKITFPDQQAFIDENKRTLIPLRHFSETLNLEVEWRKNVGDYGQIEITRDELPEEAREVEEVNITINIGESTLTCNEEIIELDSKPHITDEKRIVVPLRALSDALNFETKWSKSDNSIHIVDDSVEVDIELIEKLEDMAVENNKEEDEEDVDALSKKIYAVTEILADYGSLDQGAIEKLVTMSEDIGLDLHIILGLIRVESNFDPDNVGRVSGARGLFQIMPGTAERVANTHGYEFSEYMLFDPEYNIKLGTTYLEERYSRYGEDVHKILTAYNKGPHGLENHINIYGSAVSSFSNSVLEQAEKFKNKLEATID